MNAKDIIKALQELSDSEHRYKHMYSWVKTENEVHKITEDKLQHELTQCKLRIKELENQLRQEKINTNTALITTQDNNYIDFFSDTKE